MNSMIDLLEKNWLIVVVWCWLFAISVSRQSANNTTFFHIVKNVILSVLSATVLLGVGLVLWQGVIRVAADYL